MMAGDEEEIGADLGNRETGADATREEPAVSVRHLRKPTRCEIRHANVSIDPDATLGQCGSGIVRHVARGNCPACGGGEKLLELQWGTDALGNPALRSQCVTSDSQPVASESNPCSTSRIG